MARYFYGKEANYHTEVTASRTETIIAYASTIATILICIWTLIFIKSFWLIFLIFTISILTTMGIFLLMIFAPWHKEERLENSNLDEN